MPDVAQTSAPLAVPGALLALVGLALVPLAVALARHLFPQRVVFFARWGFSQVAGVALGAVLVGLVAAAAIPGDTVVAGLHRVLVVYAGSSLAVVSVAARRHPDPWQALGLERPLSARAAGTGVAVLLFLLPGIFGVGLLWPWLFDVLGGEFRPQEVVLGFFELEGAALAWGVFLAVAVVPFFEELLFRGFLQPLLTQNVGEQGGVALTSAIFAGLHGTAFLPIFALSYALGAVMVRTHRLAAPWAMHAAFNAINLALLLLLPDSRDLLV